LPVEKEIRSLTEIFATLSSGPSKTWFAKGKANRQDTIAIIFCHTMLKRVLVQRKCVSVKELKEYQWRIKATSKEH